MLDDLKKHIGKFVEFSEMEYSKILTYFTPVHAAKKQNLLVEGKVCTWNYFVVKGCLRLFYVNEKGVEQTIQFALENWWLSDYTSFSSGKPSDLYIQAVEKSDVLGIDFNSLEEVLLQFPRLERYFRMVHQRAHAAFQFRIKSLYTLSREELYHQFNERYPEFVQRVPQYLLASFLGFTPEYLSEIRSKRVS